MAYAWVENNTVRDLTLSNPFEVFHSDVANLFNTEIPHGIVHGATLVEGLWINPTQTEVTTQPTPVVVYPKLSPISFKMCFTCNERIAIKALKLSNPIIADAFDILDDYRLTTVDLNLQSNRDLVDYLVSISILTSDRAVEIKSGILL